ncbi:glycosyltransferase [Gordonia sp. i37]|uniref:CgeB family protein n=1 Tax=Gordonia sp. i37 TaxID=1961707 RepID=UPI0009AE40FC|nr:glycosyltransferase [Gordonia sp. i37]OPX07675.1 glycosyl transferase family 1 [Gordonia sp. i37]
MKILFVGDDWIGSNARSLADGFRAAGHDVVVIDSTRVTLPARLSASWTYSKAARRRAPWVVDRLHDEIDSVARDFRPDMLFCYKTVHLDQDRLLNVPAALRVHYSADDVANPYNITDAYLKSEHLWDLIVTTKRYNVPEVLGRGGKAALFVWSAYDPAWHFPAARRGRDHHRIGFIGACRDDRRDLMIRLGRRYGDDLLVQGPGWRRVAALQATQAVVTGPAYGQEFSLAVAKVEANLVLLNSDNRDRHTCRTFEIPAAGGLFVGERTDEHAELLDDGTECLLFSDEDELHSQLALVREHPERASGIARAGHRRITEGGHRYLDRARQIVEEVT